ncbi:MAG TPA: hypothetical protein VGX25_15875 [Actinophytocola sp.]|nr:hypothetical protein [Actinophytocola sp.]HEV2780864.1 hypothetical protein [Actinophytocola sp.]
MTEIGNWVGTAGQSAQLAGSQTQLHADAVETARDTMPDPVPWDRAAAIRDIASATNPLDAMVRAAEAQAQYMAHREAHQRAAEVVGTYDANLGGASVMPAFSRPPTMAGGDGTTSGIGGGGVGFAPNGFAGPGGSGAPDGSAGAGGSGLPGGP